MSIIERIKTKPGYKIIGIAIFLIIANNILSNKSYIEKIKNNKNIIVECNIKNKGWIEIDKSKITGIMDDGTFIFTNGYAKNCQVINMKG